MRSAGCPSVPLPSSFPDRSVLAGGVRIRDDAKPDGVLAKLGLGHLRLVIQPHGTRTLEEPATMPAVSLGPKSKRREVRQLADRGPGIRDLAVVKRPPRELA